MGKILESTSYIITSADGHLSGNGFTNTAGLAVKFPSQKHALDVIAKLQEAEPGRKMKAEQVTGEKKKQK